MRLCCLWKPFVFHSRSITHQSRNSFRFEGQWFSVRSRLPIRWDMWIMWPHCVCSSQRYCILFFLFNYCNLFTFSLLIGFKDETGYRRKREEMEGDSRQSRGCSELCQILSTSFHERQAFGNEDEQDRLRNWNWTSRRVCFMINNSFSFQIVGNWPSSRWSCCTLPRKVERIKSGRRISHASSSTPVG